MTRLSAKIAHIAASDTVRISNLAMQMKQEGVDVVSFAAGEPDFDTPAFIKKASVDAISNGVTKYTPVRGLPVLLKSICSKLKRDNAIFYTDEEIIVTTGAKQAITLALDALVDNEDEVIIAAPYWVSYPEMVKLSGGVPVIADTQPANGYKLTEDILARLITERTKVLILNSPNNPTGAVYGWEELCKIAEICIKKAIYIIADEIYEYILFDGHHRSIAGVSEDAKKRVVTVNGVSKAWAMTGWRIGYAAASKDIISAMAKLMGQRTTNACSISQMAALAALNGDLAVVSKMTDEYRKRRDLLTKGLHEIGIRCSPPPATFYLFPDIAFLLSKKYQGERIGTTYNFCMSLLQEAGVATVPGKAFGAPTHIRLSFATSQKIILEGIRRIGDFLTKLA